MKSYCLVLVLLIVVPTASPSLALELAGPVEVSDGDTVIVAGTKIRLQGIDHLSLIKSASMPREKLGLAVKRRLTRS